MIEDRADAAQVLLEPGTARGRARGSAEKVIVHYRFDTTVTCSDALDYYLSVHQWFDRGSGSIEADADRLMTVPALCRID